MRLRYDMGRVSATRGRASSNAVKYYAGNLCYYTCALFTSGTLVQTFLKTSGCTDAQVAFYGSVAGFASILGYIFTFFFADRVRSVKTALTWSVFPQLAVPLLLTLFVFGAGGPAPTLYLAVLLGTTVVNVFSAVRAILWFRILYKIVEREDFTGVLLTDSMVNSVGSILVSLGMTALFAASGFAAGVRVLFPGSVLLLLGSAVFSRRMREKPAAGPGEPAENPARPTLRAIAALLRRRDFRILLPPSFLRGMAVSALDYAVVFGINEAGLSAGDSSVVILLSRIACILAYFLYTALRRQNHGTMNLLGCVLAALALPAALAFGTAGFYVFYTAAYIGRSVVENAVPLLSYELIEEEVMGSFSTLRLLCMSLGAMLGSLLLGLLYGRVSAMSLLLAASVLFLLTGAGYQYAARALGRRPDREAAEAPLS